MLSGPEQTHERGQVQVARAPGTLETAAPLQDSSGPLLASVERGRTEPRDHSSSTTPKTQQAMFPDPS